VLRVTNIGPHIDITRYEGADIFVKGVRGENGSDGFPGLGIGLWEADQIARLWGGGPLRLIHSEPLGIGGNWASICFELSVPLTT
jgi:signal transduction histidine kinase